MGGDFAERVPIQIVNPEMCRCLGVVLLEGPSGTVAPRLHAEKNRALTIREKRPRLPGRLARYFEIQVTQPGAVRIHQGGLALRCEEEPGRSGCLAATWRIRMIRNLVTARHPRHRRTQRGESQELAAVQL